jgi:hypothetical protein
MEELIRLTKQSLSIISSATLKDDEIELLIKAGIADLKRLGINASEMTEDSLIQSAIIMFVKSNFGNTDIKEKELAQKTYSLLCNNLSLSSEYKIKEEADNNA